MYFSIRRRKVRVGNKPFLETEFWIRMRKNTQRTLSPPSAHQALTVPFQKQGRARGKPARLNCHKDVYSFKNLQCKLVPWSIRHHIVLWPLRKVPYMTEHTEYFSMTQRAEVTYYKWIMRPNAVLWGWTKKRSIQSPWWIACSGFYFLCTLNGVKQLTGIL